MYNRSKIFQEAWAMAKKQGIQIGEALKKIWAYYKNRAQANKSACFMIEIWEKFNRPADDKELFEKSRMIDSYVKSLRTAYANLAKLNTTAAVETCNIIASILKNKYKTPTYPQLFAVIVGCGEQNVIL